MFVNQLYIVNHYKFNFPFAFEFSEQKNKKMLISLKKNNFAED